MRVQSVVKSRDCTRARELSRVSYKLRRQMIAWSCGAVVLMACDGSSAPSFAEISEKIGLDFVHFNGMSGQYYFIESTGSGIVMFDYDTDGDLDLYFVQGRMLEEGAGGRAHLLRSSSPSLHRDRLFRNELNLGGRLRFSDVTAESGIDATSYGMGAAVGDVDNDGCGDLYVLNWGPNQLWRNRCDGTFEEVGAETGVADDRWGIAATFFDYDRDGWLDLYVTNYKSYALADEPHCRNKLQQKEYCAPLHFESAADALYRNRGDGTFEDVSDTALVGDRVGAGLGVLASDFDDDGWLDIYVTNDQEANFLWRNRRDGSFQEMAALSGAAVDGRGMALASMGVDSADFDGDGDMDLFMTHLAGEPNVLYENLRGGLFEDASARAGLVRTGSRYTGFGTVFLDYDNDGHLDLFVANGAVETLPELRAAGDPYPLHQPNQIFQNLGRGEFIERSTGAGAAFELSEVSRGTAAGDIDNDGDTDLVIVNNAGRARVLENLSGNRRPWIGLQLVTGEPMRIAHGARVRIDRQGGKPLYRQVRVDGSYASANDPRVLVGLGGTSQIEGVEVRWEDGTVELFPPPPLRRYSVLRQGTGRTLQRGQQ